MAINNATAQQKLDAANALARAEAILRRSVQEKPVNYATDADAAIAAAVTKLGVITSA